MLAPIARFAGCSLAAAVVDDVIFLGLHALTGSLVASIVTARLVSATGNYVTNERLVFGRGSRSRTSPWRYAALASVLLAANWALLHMLVVWAGWSALPAKLLTDTVLFLASYVVQRRFVFAGRRQPVPAPLAVDVPVPSARSVGAPMPSAPSVDAPAPAAVTVRPGR